MNPLAYVDCVEPAICRAREVLQLDPQMLA